MAQENDPLKHRFSDRAQHVPRVLTSAANKAKRDASIGVHEDFSGKYFAVERGTRHVSRFKMYLKDGRIFSVPYAFLPLIDFIPDEALTLKTSELDIVITGRSLEILCDQFNEEKVLWIKESPSGTDTEDDPVFIASIKVLEKD